MKARIRRRYVEDSSGFILSGKRFVLLCIALAFLRHDIKFCVGREMILEGI
jgi:hypothetical protein